MNQNYMKEKPVLSLVASMALPMVLSMLVNALYNIVDSFFVARISENAMTSLSLVFPLQNISGAVSIGFGVGINAAVAFRLGEGKQERAENAASAGLFLAIMHGILLSVILLAIMPFFLAQFTQDAEILQGAKTYATIVLSGAVIAQVYLVYEKLFQAIGKMKVSMTAMLLGSIANIILDPLMIFGYGPIPAMGIQGAAIATLIGQLVTVVYYLVLYYRGSLGIRLSFTSFKKSAGEWKRLYAVGLPASFNCAMPSVLITVLNSILAGFSGNGVFVLGVYYKLQTFIYLTASGIVQGIRPLVAYNYGAGEYDRVHEIIRTALVMALGVMTVGTVLCAVWPQVLMGLFTDDPIILADGAVALRLIAIGFIASTVSITVSGALEGLGEGGQSFLISFLRYIGVIIPLAFVLSGFYGAVGIWHSFWITEFVSAVISLLLYRSHSGKMMEEAESIPSLTL